VGFRKRNFANLTNFSLFSVSFKTIRGSNYRVYRVYPYVYVCTNHVTALVKRFTRTTRCESSCHTTRHILCTCKKSVKRFSSKIIAFASPAIRVPLVCSRLPLQYRRMFVRLRNNSPTTIIGDSHNYYAFIGVFRKRDDDDKTQRPRCRRSSSYRKRVH